MKCKVKTKRLGVLKTKTGVSNRQISFTSPPCTNCNSCNQIPINHFLFAIYKFPMTNN